MWATFVNFVKKHSTILVKTFLVVSTVLSGVSMFVSGGTLVPALSLAGVVAGAIGNYFVDNSPTSSSSIDDKLDQIHANTVLLKENNENFSVRYTSKEIETDKEIARLDNQARLDKEKLNETNDKLISYIHKNEEDKSIIDQDISTLKTSQRAPRVFSAGPTLFKKPAPQVTAANESNLENPTQGVRK